MWSDSSWDPHQHNQYMRQIHRDTRRVVMDAQRQAHNARMQAQQLRQDAQMQAQQLRQDAQMQAQQLRQEAQWHAQQQIQDANRQVQQSLHNVQQQGQRLWHMPPSAPPPPPPPPQFPWQQNYMQRSAPQFPTQAERERIREVREARYDAKRQMKEAELRQREQLRETRNRQREDHMLAREQERNAQQHQREMYRNNSVHHSNQGETYVQVQVDPSQWELMQTGRGQQGETVTDGGQWQEMPEGGSWESFPSTEGAWAHFMMTTNSQNDSLLLPDLNDLEGPQLPGQTSGQSSLENLETMTSNISDSNPQQNQSDASSNDVINPTPTNTRSQDEDQTCTQQSDNDKPPAIKTEDGNPSSLENPDDTTVSIKKEPGTEPETENKEKEDLSRSPLVAGADNPSISNSKPDLSTFLADAEGDLTCPICFELMRDPHTPKNLNCGHVCCLVCLTTMAQSSRNLQCPTCRFITCTAGLQIQNMRTNWHVKNLADTYYRHSQENNVTQHNFGQCKIHGDLIRYYCDTCNKIGCGSCIYENHKFHNQVQHNVKNLKEVSDKSKMEINNLLERSITKSEETKKVIDRMEKEKESYKENTLQEEEKIDAEMHDKIAKVYEEAEAKKEKLRKASEGKLQAMEKQKQHLQGKHAEIQKAVADALEAVESSTEYDYVTKHKKLARAMMTFL